MKTWHLYLAIAVLCLIWAWFITEPEIIHIPEVMKQKVCGCR